MAPADHRPLDPVGRLLAARRRGRSRRRGRRRLDPSRRHGRPFRAQHHLRSAGDQGDPRPHRQGLRLPSDDRAGRPLSRRLRRSRLRHHHRACRGRAASRPLAAGDPEPRQEGRRVAQPGDAGKRHRICARPARPGPADDGQSGLRRPGLHPGRRRQGEAGEGADRRPADRHRGRRRRHAARRRRWSPRPAPTCWSPARPSSRAAARGAYRANIAAIRQAADGAIRKAA